MVLDEAPRRCPEKLNLEVNGTRQGVFLERARDTSPVLLFLHGGPGMPEYWLTQRFPINLAEHFTTAWWEQRGAGLSFDPHISATSMKVEQFIDDTIAVSSALIERFDQPQIYLRVTPGAATWASRRRPGGPTSTTRTSGSARSPTNSSLSAWPTRSDWSTSAAPATSGWFAGSADAAADLDRAAPDQVSEASRRLHASSRYRNNT